MISAYFSILITFKISISFHFLELPLNIWLLQFPCFRVVRYRVVPSVSPNTVCFAVHVPDFSSAHRHSCWEAVMKGLLWPSGDPVPVSMLCNNSCKCVWQLRTECCGLLTNTAVIIHSLVDFQALVWCNCATLPSRDGVHFHTPWIWAGLETWTG